MKMNEDISTEQKTVEDEIPFAIDEDDAYDPEYKQESEITDSLDEVETDATENNDNSQDNDQARKGNAKGGPDAVAYASHGVTYVRCHIDSKDARGGLTHGQDIHELFLWNPVMLVYDFILHDRDHGHATAEGETTDLHEGEEKIKLLFPSYLAVFCFHC